MHFKICLLLFSFYFLTEVSASQVEYLEELNESFNSLNNHTKQDEIEDLLNEWGIQESFNFENEDDNNEKIKLLINITKHFKNVLISEDINSTILEQIIENGFNFSHDGLLLPEDMDRLYETLQLNNKEKFVNKVNKIFNDPNSGAAYITLPKLIEIILTNDNDQ
ncbi:uncharacterized protein LOC126897597 [Daktulosphaira vitifoliae]|uniref:uncharacterized protein LOC126897597 n=1 Tax=Daktulosphaira vitifoliae TaxID=58002 RepID=UPI0021AA2743|nr:uncharacterized protein LOC126897597 [Daktulosphaira vitifoliae]